MEYINPYLGFLGRFYPDVYLAPSIEDFKQERKNIPVPSLGRRLLVGGWELSPFRGLSISPFSLYGFAINGNVLVLFPNVDLRRSPEGFVLDDLATEIEVGKSFLPWIYTDSGTDYNTIPEGRYYCVMVEYNQRKEMAWLYAAYRMPRVEAQQNRGVEGLIGMVVPA